MAGKKKGATSLLTRLAILVHLYAGSILTYNDEALSNECTYKAPRATLRATNTDVILLAMGRVHCSVLPSNPLAVEKIIVGAVLEHE